MAQPVSSFFLKQRSKKVQQDCLYKINPNMNKVQQLQATQGSLKKQISHFFSAFLSKRAPTSAVFLGLQSLLSVRVACSIFRQFSDC
jgi:hypothetical protein